MQWIKQKTLKFILSLQTWTCGCLSGLPGVACRCVWAWHALASLQNTDIKCVRYITFEAQCHYNWWDGAFPVKSKAKENMHTCICLIFHQKIVWLWVKTVQNSWLWFVPPQESEQQARRRVSMPTMSSQFHCVLLVQVLLHDCVHQGAIMFKLHKYLCIWLFKWSLDS